MDLGRVITSNAIIRWTGALAAAGYVSTPSPSTSHAVSLSHTSSRAVECTMDVSSSSGVGCMSWTPGAMVSEGETARPAENRRVTTVDGRPSGLCYTRIPRLIKRVRGDYKSRARACRPPPWVPFCYCTLDLRLSLSILPILSCSLLYLSFTPPLLSLLFSTPRYSRSSTALHVGDAVPALAALTHDHLPTLLKVSLVRLPSSHSLSHHHLTLSLSHLTSPYLFSPLRSAHDARARLQAVP